MQEARSAAYFTHYTNLFGSLSHQAGDSRSLWLMRLQMMLHWSCGVMMAVWVMMAVVKNSFSSFLLTWRPFALVPSCCTRFLPFLTRRVDFVLVTSLPGSLPCQHPLHLLLIIACLPHRSVSSSPLSFRPHACEICTCQMLCFPAKLCGFLASCWSVSDSMSVSLEV